MKNTEKISQFCRGIVSNSERIEDSQFLLILDEELKEVNLRDQEILIFELVTIEKLSYEEVAAQLNLSEKRIRNVYSEAKKKIKKAITNCI
ncbi:sigma factor-like helix-turn-helix DNA-binding protein [Lysinibacillus sp. NPDC098008]|uniref:sigma factor-like helix-turn-helix DNA-binding protein n=1 Tax=Lysinibacillus sp. NPDC098008 TaxID=3364146 RepID=UPI0038166C63